MNTHKKSVLRWHVLVSCLAILSLTMACAGITLGSTSDEALQIEDGVVQVKDENGDWTPVAGSATFELVGELTSMDPWTVAGKTFETNELTQIADGLQVGDLVRVQGAVLEDDTWVAYSIQPAEEQTDPTIVLIGRHDLGAVTACSVAPCAATPSDQASRGAPPRYAPHPTFGYERPYPR